MTVLDDALDEHIRTLVNEALFTAPKENQKHIVVAEAQLKAFISANYIPLRKASDG